MALKRLRNFFSNKEKLKNSVVLIVSTIIIVIGLIFLIIYRETFLALIPGFYQFDQYKKLLSDRDSLIDNNNNLLNENVKLVEEISNLGNSTEDYQSKSDLAAEIQSNLQKALKNTKKAKQTDNSILLLRLITHVKRYVLILLELDNTSEKAREEEVSVAESRIYYYNFRLSESKFNNCVADIDRQNYTYSKENEQKIATDLLSCLDILKETRTDLNELEDLTKTELPLNNTYLQNTEAFWNNSYNFHLNLAKGNVSEAEKYDEQASDYKRILSDLNLDDVFNEFNTVILAPKIDTVSQFVDDAEGLQQRADKYFEENLE